MPRPHSHPMSQAVHVNERVPKHMLYDGCATGGGEKEGMEEEGGGNESQDASRRAQPRLCLFFGKWLVPCTSCRSPAVVRKRKKEEMGKKKST